MVSVQSLRNFHKATKKKKKIAVKNLPEMQEMWICGLDPWVRRIPWRRKWQPTPVILPRKSMDRGAWQATVNGVAKELNTIEQLNKKVAKNSFLSPG